MEASYDADPSMIEGTN